MRNFTLQCASGSTLTEPARLYSATGLTHCPTLRMTIMERYLMQPIHRSEEASKEIPHGFMFVCIGRAGVCAESRMALGIPDLFWLVRLQLLHMDDEEPSQSKTTKFWLFFFSSFTFSPLLSLEKWLLASQLYNQALHLYFIDRCYFLHGWGNMVCFLNLGKRLNSIARWYMLWKAMLMLESSCTIWLKGTLKPGIRGNSINTMQVYPETEHVSIYCLTSNDHNLTCKLEMQLACPIWLMNFL